MRLPSAPSFLLLLAACATVPVSPAQTAAHSASARIVFTFEHPQLQPSKYAISIDENGAGQYTSQPGPASDPTDGVYPTPLDRPLHLDDALRTALFSYARSHSLFATHCTTAKGNLAFTGNKSFSYTGPEGSGSCTFVWAEDPALQHLADDLGAVAFTLEEGRRLAVEASHDRLGLDAELESLQNAVKEHRAADLSNIADQLHAVADDQQVMNRARKRAATLLSQSETPPAAN